MVQRVEPPRAGDAHVDQATVAAHTEVLRHGRLAHRELLANGSGQIAGTVLLVGEELEESAVDRIAEKVEWMHVQPSAVPV